MNIDKLQKVIFRILPQDFLDTALSIFRRQYEQVVTYKSFVDLTALKSGSIASLQTIPFLPISLFKQHKILSRNRVEEVVFESSTTTSQISSKHFVADASLYQESFSTAFKYFFGEIENTCILGLLPSYLERGNSSLVYMVNRFIGQSQHPLSGFYLHNHYDLASILQELETKKQPTILLGVTYALLDFAEHFPMPLHNVRIMETGGMKGRREEWTRTEVHDYLKKQFKLPQVYSEYGMTELLSQAYSLQDEIFRTPPWMKILIRDMNDPKEILTEGRGAINVIDLANIHSCSFIATDDVGELYPDGSFKILGRLDASEWRGCSLLSL